MTTKWKFEDPENVAVFTSHRILRGEDWIHYVTHDEDDGAWQFHPSSGPTPEGEAAVVSLRSIVERDSSVEELWNLPVGTHAWRDSVNAPWQRARKPPTGE
jgi:hypothetical protein